MDRRQFVKKILTASILAPFLLESKTGADETGAELYLISDEPQRHLGLLLQALRAQGLMPRPSFIRQSPHPQAAELGRALSDWRLSSSGGAAGISFRRLEAAIRPSFTLVENGRVVDPRRLGLSGLWRAMQSAEAATGLTIVSFKAPVSNFRPGSFAAVSREGEKIDRFPLDAERSVSYAVRGGRVIVGLERGAVRVKSSPCRHQICVASSPILYAGERIVCAPNRFLVEIEGRSLVDTLTG